MRLSPAASACAHRSGGCSRRRRPRASRRPGCTRGCSTPVRSPAAARRSARTSERRRRATRRQPVGTASVFPSGLTAIPRSDVAAPCMIPTAAGAAQEVGEQVAAGLRRVVDRDRLAGEQEREVEVLLDERLGAEALGELGRLRVARLAALDERRRSRRRRPPPARPRPRRAAPAGAGWYAGRASSPAPRPRGSR